MKKDNDILHVNLCGWNNFFKSLTFVKSKPWRSIVITKLLSTLHRIQYSTKELNTEIDYHFISKKIYIVKINLY